MPFESPIASLRESYRPVPDTPTVVMPLLIAAVGFAMAVFYFKTRPEQVPAPTASLPTAPMLVAEPIMAEPPVDAAEEAPSREPLPLVAVESISESEFTPWLSHLALETYIRSKNRGSRGNFWQQGHWIRAVEGRWREGTHELRIVVGKIEPGQRFRWQYRIDMTEIQFAEALARLGGEGFRLVQSHAYRRPNGEKRYQAVWRTDPDGEGDDLVRR